MTTLREALATLSDAQLRDLVADAYENTREIVSVLKEDPTFPQEDARAIQARHALWKWLLARAEANGLA